MSRRQFSALDFRNITRILNLPDATDPQHPVTLAQLRAGIEGLAWKDSVRVSTQGNLNLAAPGAAIDGVTMVAGDRFIARSQTTGADNGLYVWNGSAVAATRSADASTFDELEQAVVSVEEGTNAGTTWRQSAVNGTIGVTTVTWGPFGTSAPNASESTAGVAEIATQAETDTGTDDARMLTPAKMANWAGRIRKYSVAFGDNSATSFVITHNLNTRDVHVAVYAGAGSYDEPTCDIEHTSVNTVTLRFDTAPTTNEFRAVVIG